MANQLFGWKFYKVQQGTLYHHQNHEQVNFYNDLRLFIVDRSVRGVKVIKFLPMVQNCNVSTMIWQVFPSTLATTLRCFAERNRWAQVCSRCKLWIYRFLKKQRYKVIVNLWQFMWKNFISKAFVYLATAGRYRGLSTIYINHNLFQ